MGGTGCEDKRKALQRILARKRVNFVSIQETKMAKADSFRIKSLWGNYDYDFAESLALGRSGGLLSIWDLDSLKKEDSMIFDRFIVVKGTWVASNVSCHMINLYAPQNENEKVKLWSKILAFMDSNSGNLLICGDFNSVRGRDDRMGTLFSSVNASNFNLFITTGNLIDIPMGRHKYTRISRDGLKASRLDRFLVNHSFADSFPNVILEALDDIISDHRPLLLMQRSMDYGPTPFKLYNSWMMDADFDMILNDSWVNVDGSPIQSAFVTFKDKLKKLKNNLKTWRKSLKNVAGLDDITADSYY
uniref:uncharacterized protein LOC122583137 n=1 Tax=Erigeron canadensis TaxID=72917 RepID=UPI001CB90A83|nr:uncharacterized protein LOC122583137 [Erigeron canadensis]